MSKINAVIRLYLADNTAALRTRKLFFSSLKTFNNHNSFWYVVSFPNDFHINNTRVRISQVNHRWITHHNSFGSSKQSIKKKIPFKLVYTEAISYLLFCHQATRQTNRSIFYFFHVGYPALSNKQYLTISI